MPTPDFIEIDDETLDRPQTSTEIIGVGSKSRKSKTFIKDMELASLLAFIDGHVDMLIDLFRRTHAKHFKVPARITVDKTDENGYPILDEDGDVEQEVVVKMCPEILTEDQLRDKYPVISSWERMHQKQVDHFASIGGFSVRAATGMGEDETSRRARKESSAGTDRRTGQGDLQGNDRWS